jgi:hypothetical protein
LERFRDLPHVPFRLQYGNCLPSAPVNDHPSALFMEDQPLAKVVNKDSSFYTLNSLEID